MLREQDGTGKCEAGLQSLRPHPTSLREASFSRKREKERLMIGMRCQQ